MDRRVGMRMAGEWARCNSSLIREGCENDARGAKKRDAIRITREEEANNKRSSRSCRAGQRGAPIPPSGAAVASRAWLEEGGEGG